MTELKNLDKKESPVVRELVPGSFCKCYNLDVDNLLCTKYDIKKWSITDYTWEYHCLKDGGCDR